MEEEEGKEADSEGSPGGGRQGTGRDEGRPVALSIDILSLHSSEWRLYLVQQLVESWKSPIWGPCGFASTRAPTVTAALSLSESRTPPTHPPPSCQSTTTTQSSDHRLSSPKLLSFVISFLPWSRPTRVDAQQSRTSRLHCEPVLISLVSLSYTHTSSLGLPGPNSLRLTNCPPAGLVPKASSCDRVS